MNFGMVTDEAPACEIMDAALEAGINYFDTADVYGGPQKPDIAKGYGVTRSPEAKLPGAAKVRW